MTAQLAVLDRSSPLPLWAQIVDDLQARLATGEFDQRFPTDDQLVSQYGVSRQTVREAVRRLQVSGLLERQRGRGTRLVRPVLEQPVNALYSLARTVSAHGMSERSEVRAAERQKAPEDAAAHLNLRPGAPVLFLERLRLADEEPLSLERSWMPWAVAAPLLRHRPELERGPIYQTLAARCGVRITSAKERISPIIPPPADRQLLDLPARTAAFLVEHTALAEGIPVEWRCGTVRGDRYCFTAEWPGSP
jgi:GntR family transcriptional regulator